MPPPRDSHRLQGLGPRPGSQTPPWNPAVGRVGRAPPLCCSGARGGGPGQRLVPASKGRVAGAPPSPQARAPEAEENTRPLLPSGPSELGNLSLKVTADAKATGRPGPPGCTWVRAGAPPPTPAVSQPALAPQAGRTLGEKRPGGKAPTPRCNLRRQARAGGCPGLRSSQRDLGPGGSGQVQAGRGVAVGPREVLPPGRRRQTMPRH